MSARNRISPCVWAGRTRALPGGLSLLCHVHARIAQADASKNLTMFNVLSHPTIYRRIKQQQQAWQGADCCDCSECFKLG